MADLDRLSAVLEQFPVRAGLFHQGALCGSSLFEVQTGRGFLHVLRKGTVTVVHEPRPGVPTRLVVDRPSLLFYPRALRHEFMVAPAEGADFTCATVSFAGGDTHPIARALPPLLVVSLDELAGLQSTLALLFDETEHVRCGSRLLADRLFEVVLLQLLRWLLDQGIASAGLVAGLGDRRLARALTAIHEAPAEAWTLDRLARTAGMSRSAFAARFHAVLDTTPGEYLAEWRLARATLLLRQGRPLSAVAGEVGYSSHAALSRAFRQRRGVPPREWLRAEAVAAEMRSG